MLDITRPSFLGGREPTHDKSKQRLLASLIFTITHNSAFQIAPKDIQGAVMEAHRDLRGEDAYNGLLRGGSKTLFNDAYACVYHILIKNWEIAQKDDWLVKLAADLYPEEGKFQADKKISVKHSIFEYTESHVENIKKYSENLHGQYDGYRIASHQGGAYNIDEDRGPYVAHFLIDIKNSPEEGELPSFVLNFKTKAQIGTKDFNKVEGTVYFAGQFSWFLGWCHASETIFVMASEKPTIRKSQYQALMLRSDMNGATVLSARTVLRANNSAPKTNEDIGEYVGVFPESEINEKFDNIRKYIVNNANDPARGTGLRALLM